MHSEISFKPYQANILTICASHITRTEWYLLNEPFLQLNNFAMCFYSQNTYFLLVPVLTTSYVWQPFWWLRRPYCYRQSRKHFDSVQDRWQYVRRECVVENLVPEDERITGKLHQIGTCGILQLLDQVSQLDIVIDCPVDTADDQSWLDVRTRGNKQKMFVSFSGIIL